MRMLALLIVLVHGLATAGPQRKPGMDPAD
jgi:hypothetical protein